MDLEQLQRFKIGMRAFLILAYFSCIVDGKAFLENYGSDDSEIDMPVSYWGYSPEAYSHVLPYDRDNSYSYEPSIQVAQEYYEPYVDGGSVFVPDVYPSSSLTKEVSDYESGNHGSIENEQNEFELTGEISDEPLEEYYYELEEGSFSEKENTKNIDKEKPVKDNWQTSYDAGAVITKTKDHGNEKVSPDKEIIQSEKINMEKTKNDKTEEKDMSSTYEIREYEILKIKPEKSDEKKKPIKMDPNAQENSDSKGTYEKPASIDMKETKDLDQVMEIDMLANKEKQKNKATPSPEKTEKDKSDKLEQDYEKPDLIKTGKDKSKENKIDAIKKPDPKNKAGNNKEKPEQDYEKPEMIKTENDKSKENKIETIKKPDLKTGNGQEKSQNDDDYSVIVKQISGTKDVEKDKPVSKEAQNDYATSDVIKEQPKPKTATKENSMKYDIPVETKEKFKEPFKDSNAKPDTSLEVQVQNGDRTITNDEKAQIEHVLELLNPGEQSRRFLSALNTNLWSLIFNQNAQLQKFKKCVTRKNETGSCMNIQFCSIPNIASTLEQLLNNACVIDDLFIGICCPDFPAESVKVDWGQTIEIQETAELSSDSNDCGERSNIAIETHSWPWKAPLLAKSNGKVFCGGVLISKRYVLTAAHCTTKIPRNQILVRLGEHSSTSGEDVPVMEIKRHAQYNPRTMQDDIALLKLVRSIKLDDFVSVVCLPEYDDDHDFDDNYEGSKALLLGWHGSPGQVKEKDESLTVMNRTTCKDQLGVAISESILCTDARNENERTCNADSGAPLIVETENKYEVLGVLSWNRNDCDPRFPSTFSSVPYYRKWISKHSK